jgi:hypothetical protein
MNDQPLNKPLPFNEQTLGYTAVFTEVRHSMLDHGEYKDARMLNGVCPVGIDSVTKIRP